MLRGEGTYDMQPLLFARSLGRFPCPHGNGFVLTKEQCCAMQSCYLINSVGFLVSLVCLLH